jgi:hypothetical protein
MTTYNNMHMHMHNMLVCMLLLLLLLCMYASMYGRAAGTPEYTVVVFMHARGVALLGVVRLSLRFVGP